MTLEQMLQVIRDNRWHCKIDSFDNGTVTAIITQGSYEEIGWTYEHDADFDTVDDAVRFALDMALKHKEATT